MSRLKYFLRASLPVAPAHSHAQNGAGFQFDRVSALPMVKGRLDQEQMIELTFDATAIGILPSVAA
ncbi:MAG: hypothetical protein AB1813_26160 [Verrucomicrobiota bacterium]